MTEQEAWRFLAAAFARKAAYKSPLDSEIDVTGTGLCYAISVLRLSRSLDFSVAEGMKVAIYKHAPAQNKPIDGNPWYSWPNTRRGNLARSKFAARMAKRK